MKINDESIGHLKILGQTLDEAKKNLTAKFRAGKEIHSERAEIVYASKFKDGGTPHSLMKYVVGVCGEREAIKEGDLDDDVYRILYFGESTLKDSKWVPGEPTFENFLLWNVMGYEVWKED